MASAQLAATCPICRENLDEISEAVAIACGHVFHNRCVTEWLKQSKTCPQCRRQLRNPQKDLTRIYLSFGNSECESDEPGGLAELRQRLAAVTLDSEEAKKKLRKIEKRDARLRRDVNQRQRKIDEFARQLDTCQESMAQQEAENSQLMQLLGQEHHELCESRQLRTRLDEELLAKEKLVNQLRELEALMEQLRRQRLAEAQAEGRTTDLRRRLEAAQRESALLDETLQTEKSENINLLDELLAREAESFELDKRLNSCQADNSRLTDKLRQSELMAAKLSQQLLLLRTGVEQSAETDCDNFHSLPNCLLTAAVANEVSEILE